MPYPLTLTTMPQRSRWLFPGKEIVSRDYSGVHRDNRTMGELRLRGPWITEEYYREPERTKEMVRNTMMAHPAVAEAAVIAIPHEKWVERPMACVVLKPGRKGKVSEKDLLDFLAARVAKWWLPDEVVFVDAIPKTSVGKFAKRELREKFREKRYK